MLWQGGPGKVGLGMGAALCAATTVMAGAAVWLLLTEPVKMATAMTTGDVGVLARAVLGVVVSAVQSLVGYLL